MTAASVPRPATVSTPSERAGKTMRLLVLLAAASLFALVLAQTAQAAFGLQPGSFVAKTHPTVPLKIVGTTTNEALNRAADIATIKADTPITQAGAHPGASASFAFNLAGSVPEDNVKDIGVETPPGFLGDPNAVPACTLDAFAEMTISGSTTGCSPASQVGVATVNAVEAPGPETFPVYRLVAAFGRPATFGFVALLKPILLIPRLRSDGDYGLTISSVNTTTLLRRKGPTVTLWGVPDSPTHDADRWNPTTHTWGISVTGAQVKPFLINPTYCDSGPLDTRINVDSWQDAEQWLPEMPEDPNYLATSPVPSGCNQLRFGGLAAPASLAFQPTTHAADTPSGYNVKLSLPYSEEPEALANPTLRDTKVTLPEGVALNPSAANGLEACTEAQIGYIGSGFALPNPIHFNEEEPRCPAAAKIGTVEVTSPLLEEPLDGAVYLAKQYDNPFHSLFAIYIAIDDAKTGIVVKLAGHVETDPATGQITATFTNSPQLPFTEFDLSFFEGPGAALVNPQACGTKTTTTELTPWSAPYTGPPLASEDSYTINRGANGTACSMGGAEEPDHPKFSAGTLAPLPAAYSPFALKLSRDDGTQRLDGLNLVLPQGLTGKLDGILYCNDADIEAAKETTGTAQIATPSCPAASEVGVVRVGAGAGSSPVYVTGHAYLAGPYKGALLSLAVITPAVAGPFDLGTVVVRVPLYVNEETAQIMAKSDPLPTILEGIPLDVRSVSIEMNRPQFTLNPSSCEEMAITGEAISTTGQVAPLSNRFQLGGCSGLKFEPSLHTRVFGSTKRNAKPSFRAVLEAKPSEANISRTAVTLPHSEFLEQAHIKTICTRVQFAAGAVPGEGCPAGSIYGNAQAFTPLLEKPLEGPVYLRANGGERQLPDLVAALHGQININLVGYIDSVGGGIRTRFDTVPDAPVSKFILNMRGGSRGLLVNSRNLCEKPSYATVKMDAHSGAIHDFRPLLQNDCNKKATGKSGGHRAKKASLRRLLEAW